MAMVAAGFTGGQADELRRAMGFKRSMERMNAIEDDLRRGMTKNRIAGAAQDEIIQGIKSFALYGFPESHAASFALIAYASAYLKAHHPAAFVCALLNNWPMGFYHPSTLVNDAVRHGVTVRPIDVTISGWLADLEDAGQAVRLGLRSVAGLREVVGKRIETARAAAPFASLADFARRSGADEGELDRLAEIGALAALGGTRRTSLWQIDALGRSGELFLGMRRRPPARLAAARDDGGRRDGSRLRGDAAVRRPAPGVVRARRPRARGASRAPPTWRTSAMGVARAWAGS